MKTKGIILNYKEFKKNEPLVDKLLMICEQVPGLIAKEDVTPILERGYFASYNIELNILFIVEL